MRLRIAVNDFLCLGNPLPHRLPLFFGCILQADCHIPHKLHLPILVRRAAQRTVQPVRPHFQRGQIVAGCIVAQTAGLVKNSAQLLTHSQNSSSLWG